MRIGSALCLLALAVVAAHAEPSPAEVLPEAEFLEAVVQEAVFKDAQPKVQTTKALNKDVKKEEEEEEKFEDEEHEKIDMQDDLSKATNNTAQMKHLEIAKEKCTNLESKTIDKCQDDYCDFMKHCYVGIMHKKAVAYCAAEMARRKKHEEHIKAKARLAHLDTHHADHDAPSKTAPALLGTRVERMQDWLIRKKGRVLNAAKEISKIAHGHEMAMEHSKEEAEKAKKLMASAMCQKKLHTTYDDCSKITDATDDECEEVLKAADAKFKIAHEKKLEADADKAAKAEEDKAHIKKKAKSHFKKKEDAKAKKA